MGKKWKQCQTLFFGAPKSLQMVTATMKLKDAYSLGRLRAKPPGFSRVAAGALDLRLGPQGPALVASGKASPHASSSLPFGIPLPLMPGPKTLCELRAGT